jgi:hypothetical membrane protein
MLTGINDLPTEARHPVHLQQGGNGLMERYLWSGVAGPLVYLATVVAGGVVTPGYSHLLHAVSELTQRGAPHALVLGAGFALSAVLCGIFGVAIAAADRRLLVAGSLIAGYGILAFLLATVFPQDPIGADFTFTGTMHLVLVGVSAVMLVAAILAAGLKLRDRLSGFLTFSALAVGLMLAGGAASGVMIARGIALVGLAERVTLIAYLSWFLVFAAALMLRPHLLGGKSAGPSGAAPGAPHRY